MVRELGVSWARRWPRSCSSSDSVSVSQHEFRKGALHVDTKVLENTSQTSAQTELRHCYRQVRCIKELVGQHEGFDGLLRSSIESLQHGCVSNMQAAALQHTAYHCKQVNTIDVPKREIQGQGIDFQSFITD